MRQEIDCNHHEHRALIALGSNLPSVAGTPAETIHNALSLLKDAGVKVLDVSRLYMTPCFPAGAGPDFVNAAATVVCELSPTDLLTLLHHVEARLGRVRETRWAGRTLDIDIIAIGDRILPDRETFLHWQNLPPDRQRDIAPSQLILPHPRMQDRGFVLIPLADIAPDWRHPVLDLSVTDMLRQLPESARQGVKPL